MIKLSLQSLSLAWRLKGDAASPNPLITWLSFLVISPDYLEAI